MKTLWKNDDLALVIVDDRNYSVGRPYVDKKTGKDAMANTSYFNGLDSAVRHIARLEASENGYDLTSWLREFKSTVKYFSEILEGTNV